MLNTDLKKKTESNREEAGCYYWDQYSEGHVFSGTSDLTSTVEPCTGREVSPRKRGWRLN